MRIGRIAVPFRVVKRACLARAPASSEWCRAGVVAVHLEREKVMKRFNFKDITDAFRDAKESKTPAQSQNARAVIMGFLANEGDQFYATSKAEALVDTYNKN
jgi:hypothetical protein